MYIPYYSYELINMVKLQVLYVRGRWNVDLCALYKQLIPSIRGRLLALLPLHAGRLRTLENTPTQLGTFYTHEDKFTLVKWHHQRCVVAPKCLTHPVDLCGIEDLKGEDLDRVMNWLGFGPTGSGKDRSWTA